MCANLGGVGANNMMRKRLCLALACLFAYVGSARAEETTYRCSRLFAIGLEVESVTVRVHAHDYQEAVSLCEPELLNYATPDAYGVPKESRLLRRSSKRFVYWNSYDRVVADMK